MSHTCSSKNLVSFERDEKYRILSQSRKLRKNCNKFDQTAIGFCFRSLLNWELQSINNLDHLKSIRAIQRPKPRHICVEHKIYRAGTWNYETIPEHNECHFVLEKSIEIANGEQCFGGERGRDSSLVHLCNIMLGPLQEIWNFEECMKHDLESRACSWAAINDNGGK